MRRAESKDKTARGDDTSPEKSPPTSRTYLEGLQESERTHETSVQRLADSRKYYSNFFKDNLKQGKLNYSLQGKLSDSEAEDDESVDPEEKNDAIEGEEKLRGIKKPKLPQIKLSNTGKSSR